MTQTRNRPRPSQTWLFARNFFKHPMMLGSVIPSSRFLIDHLLAQVDWARAKVFVEYGPGVGTITRHVLKRMRPDAKMIVVETNRDFVNFLRSTVADPRLHVVHGSAAEVRGALSDLGLGQADYVISGIPFSTLPPEVGEAVIKATRDVLYPEGTFLVYQFSKAVQPGLERHFRHIRTDFEPLNIPPARLYYCRP
ncbi:MAG: methyltransferase [Gemmatimonadota bacterium]